MAKRAAIILAGGKAQRFQTNQEIWQDKALVKLDCKPLLIHVVENVKQVVDEVVIVVNEEYRKLQYEDVLSSHNINNVKIIIDVKIHQLSGPIIAILTGLKYTNADYCLTIPADMPLLCSKVAEYMFNEIKDSNIVVPMWPNGRLETLIMVLKRTSTLPITNVITQLGRTRPDDITRGALRTLFVSPLGQIKSLDPELKSFVNINFPQDLTNLQPRPTPGPVIEDLRLNLGNLTSEQLELLLEAALKADIDFSDSTKLFSDCAAILENEGLDFWAALSREFEAKTLLNLTKGNRTPESTEKVRDAFLKASLNYALEAETYEQKSCFFLAERAETDKLWCESRQREAIK